jgi:hypothetical protein
MACRPARGGWHGKLGSRPSTRAQGRGSSVAAPFESRAGGLGLAAGAVIGSARYISYGRYTPSAQRAFRRAAARSHLIFHRKTLRSQKHSLSASAAGQVGEHPFYAPHATIRCYLRHILLRRPHKACGATQKLTAARGQKGRPVGSCRRRAWALSRDAALLVRIEGASLV